MSKLPHRLALRWNSTHARDGFALLDGDGGTLFPACSPWLRLCDPATGTPLLDPDSNRRADLQLQLHLQTDRTASGALLLTLVVTNTSRTPCSIDTIGPLHHGSFSVRPEQAARRSPVAASGLTGWSAWIHGRQMTSDAFSHRFGRGESHATLSGRFRQYEGEDTHWASHALLVLSSPEQRVHLLLGFVSQRDQFTEITWSVSGQEEAFLGSLTARCHLEGSVLPPGASLSSETLMIALGDDPVELAEQYARETARRMGARVPKQIPTGWCSWYYFYNRVTEQDVRSNLQALTQGPYKVDYVQIDDGFQSATGDWLIPNEKFPRGMGPLAREIAEAGFRPGLWLSPFTLHRDARVLAEHPEWALKDAKGNIIYQDIWLGPCAGLDCTHPGAQEWLRHLIHTVVKEWGYTFLKLDALFSACIEHAVHYEPNTTTAANLRRGLAIIREAAGDDTFILGCSCPFGPAIGLVDAMRVGPDMETRWFNGLQPSVKHALRLALQRTWMHRRFWLNDPDCLTIRDNESTLTLEEARFLATGVALSGGLLVLSDDLTTLSPERRAVALRVLKPTGRAARPLDLLDRETPALWSLPLRGGRRAIAVLNWDDEPMDAVVTWDRLRITGPRFAREQWTETDLGRIEGELRLPRIPPHAARVVILDPHAPPRRTRRLLPI